MPRRSLPTGLVIVLLLFVAAPSIQAAPLPSGLQSPSSSFARLWVWLMDIASLGHSIDPNGGNGDLGHEMDPNGANGDLGHAIALFQEAARREEVTAEQVRRLVKYLQEARNDPAMRFE